MVNDNPTTFDFKVSLCRKAPEGFPASRTEASRTSTICTFVTGRPSFQKIVPRTTFQVSTVMQAHCTRDVVMALVLATGFVLTGCALDSPTVSDSTLPPDGQAYSGSKQTDAELQRLTRQLTPAAPASQPDDVPISERIIRQPPNKLGIIVIPDQPAP